MPGGLVQLVGVGAQNELVNGNPSMTHFRAVYRRHTNFAMEHIRMTFDSSNLQFSTSGTRTLSCRIDRYAQLIHDCYFVLTLPDIWSPLKYLEGAVPPAGYDPRTNSIGYEFEWIRNIGYNLIDRVDLRMNGQVIQTLSGEWLKFYSYLTHDANKRKIVDEMVGNVPQLYDPANAYDRLNQYPHALTPLTIPSTGPATKTPEPSIRSRQLVVPLHFWFCENPGLALPLVSLQNSEVYIDVVIRNVNDLYTVIDVNPKAIVAVVTAAEASGTEITYTTASPHGLSGTAVVTVTNLSNPAFNVSAASVTSVVSPTRFTVASTVTAIALSGETGNVSSAASNPTYGQRVRPTNYPLSLFLSPPLSTGAPSNPLLTTWFPDPYIEGNFIYLTELEMNQLARADQTYLIKTLRHITNTGQYGANTDLELPFFNLVTRIVFASQRTDRILANDWDNYTNWTDPFRAPWSPINTDVATSILTSGQQQITSTFPRDALIDGVLLFDANERFQTKPLPFFSLLQVYKHTTGQSPEIPGVYMYSFALDHDSYQPSGAANGSMFNKVILRLSLQQPLAAAVISSTNSTGAVTETPTSNIVCVVKSTIFSQNPVVVPAAQIGLYDPSELVTVVQANNNIVFTFTYNVGVYVESTNFLRIVSGLGNLVFAS
jgi:hypothetical protein